MSYHPNLAQWRLDNGSRCDLCPLRGQRVVGTDGPLNASHICIAEAPGQQEEEWGIRYGETFGRPLVGPTGGLWKHEELAGAGGDLVRVIDRSEQEKPPLALLNDVFVTNVVMCRPPKNKLDNPLGRKAAAACAPSLRKLLRRMLAENPNRMIEWMGATALAFSRNRLGYNTSKGRTKPAISPWRGRPIEPTQKNLDRLNAALADVPDEVLDKYLLRGVKPKEEWWGAQEKVLKQILTWNRASVKKYRTTPPLEYEPHNLILKLLLSRQRSALKKRREKDCGNCETL